MSGRKKRSDRDAKAVEAARKLFRAFHEEEPGQVTTAQLRLPRAAAKIGELVAVIYQTHRQGKREKYIHRFRADARPTFLASGDGRQLLILAGHFHFNERGIVDVAKKTR